MQRTAGQLIQGSLQLIGELAPGEPLGPSDGAKALDVLNELLDAWGTERLTLYAQGRTPNVLANAQQRYTIGASGANWTMDPRPFWLDRVTRLEVATGIEREIANYSRDQWARVTLKGLSGEMPFGIYYNPEFPLGKVDVYPVPTGTKYQIVLYAPEQALASVASVNTVISVPQGWQRALRYNLAVALYPEFGIQVDGSVLAIAADSKADIKRTAESPEEMVLDAGVLGSQRGMIDRSTGEVL